MKKLNVNDVGAVWTLLILLVVVITMSYLEPLFIMLLLIAILLFTVPYIFVWIWNYFIAEKNNSDVNNE